MKIHLEKIKTNIKFHGKKSGFVDSGFVKTCDELVIDPEKMQKSADIEYKRLCAIYGVGNQKHCRFCDFVNSKTSAVKRHLKCHLLSTGNILTTSTETSQN